MPNFQVLKGHTSDVNWVDFTGTKLLVSCSNDKTVRLWEADDDGKFQETSLSPLTGHSYGVNCVRFSPFGTIIASCSTDGNIILWNTHVSQSVNCQSRLKLSNASDSTSNFSVWKC